MLNESLITQLNNTFDPNLYFFDVASFDSVPFVLPPGPGFPSDPLQLTVDGDITMGAITPPLGVYPPGPSVGTYTWTIRIREIANPESYYTTTLQIDVTPPPPTPGFTTNLIDIVFDVNNTLNLSLSNYVDAVYNSALHDFSHSSSNTPDWLNVASDGTVTGTPIPVNGAPTALGVVSWSVKVYDTTYPNISDTAALRITIIDSTLLPLPGMPNFTANPVIIDVNYGDLYSGSITDYLDAAFDPAIYIMEKTFTGSPGSMPECITMQNNGDFAMHITQAVPPLGTNPALPPGPSTGTYTWEIKLREINNPWAFTTTTLQINIGSVDALNYETWADENFAPTDPKRGMNDDWDSDGVPNLLEYALATDPKSGNNAPNAPQITSINGTTYTIEYTRDTRIGDGPISFEISPDLVSWTTATEGIDYTTMSITDNGDGTETLLLDFTGIVTPQFFLRMKVTID